MLHNSVKGGIRLSFSKNPLGVRSGQNMGQNNSGSMGGMNGLAAGPGNSFAAANGPPPGLSAPPGLGGGRSVPYGSGASSLAGGNAGNSYTSQSNGWGGFHGAMATGGPSTVMTSTSSGYPSFMMGK